MPDQNPMRTARRTTAREGRFGMDAFCLFCGYAHLEVLTTRTRRWLEEKGISKNYLDRSLEDHHAFGSVNDPDLIVTLCLNCHREITEGLARAGVSMRPTKNQHKITIDVLRASADLFERLAKSYRQNANLLEDHLENL
jgi:hypothetical protein